MVQIEKANTDGRPPSPQAREALQIMLRKIGQTQEVELTCGEIFDLLDQYTEMVVNGEDVTQLMPLVKQHLDMCRIVVKNLKPNESPAKLSGNMNDPKRVVQYNYGIITASGILRFPPAVSL